MSSPPLLMEQGGWAGTATGAFTNIRTGEGAQGQRRISELRMAPPSYITFGDHMVLLWHTVLVPRRRAAYLESGSVTLNNQKVVDL